MKQRFIKYIFIIFAAASFVACECKDCEKPEQDSHTLIMFLVASNNLNGALYNNIQMALNGMTVDFPKNGSVYVYWHGYSEKSLYKLTAPSKKGTGAEKTLVKSYAPTLTFTKESMKTVLSDVRDMAPAEHYGIVLGSHAMGWFPSESDPTTGPGQYSPMIYSPYAEHNYEKAEGELQTRYFGSDNGLTMSIDDLKEGLSAIDFDYILFDACFMSSIEVLWNLRNSADYIIASPAEIIDIGFPYNNIIPILFQSESDMDARVSAAGRAFVNYYLGKSGDSRSASIVVVETDKLPALAQSVKTIFSGPLKDFDIGNLQAYEKMSNKAFFDLYHYMSLICGDGQSLANFQTAFQNAVIYEGHTANLYGNVGGKGTFSASNVSGISAYIPRSALPFFAGKYFATDWAEFVGTPIYN